MKTFVENTALPAGSPSQEGPSERPESHPPFALTRKQTLNHCNICSMAHVHDHFWELSSAASTSPDQGTWPRWAKEGWGDVLGTGMILMQAWRETGIKSWVGLKMGVPHSCALKHLFHTHRVHGSTYLYLKWMSSVCLMLKSDESECPAMCRKREKRKCSSLVTLKQQFNIEAKQIYNFLNKAEVSYTISNPPWLRNFGHLVNFINYSHFSATAPFLADLAHHCLQPCDMGSSRTPYIHITALLL